MSQTRIPGLLDMVAVLNAVSEPDVEVGDVETVVEVLPPHGIEVEFLDPNGRTRCLATLAVDDVLVLNRARTRVA